MSTSKGYKGALEGGINSIEEIVQSFTTPESEETHAASDQEGTAASAAQQPKATEEKPTARLNISLKPSLKEDLVILSYIEKRAVTYIVNDACAAYVAQNRETIDQYKAIFGGKEADDKKRV